jgi:hypothetical protein
MAISFSNYPKSTNQTGEPAYPSVIGGTCARTSGTRDYERRLTQISRGTSAAASGKILSEKSMMFEPSFLDGTVNAVYLAMRRQVRYGYAAPWR